MIRPQLSVNEFPEMSSAFSQTGGNAAGATCRIKMATEDRCSFGRARDGICLLEARPRGEVSLEPLSRCQGGNQRREKCSFRSWMRKYAAGVPGTISVRGGIGEKVVGECNKDQHN